MAKVKEEKRGEIILYKAKSGPQVEVRLQGETMWATQDQIAKLFGTTKQNVSQHLKGVFDAGELKQKAVVKDFFTTAADGKEYKVKFYNLDAVISVGYRVNSTYATQFRIWATRVLREHITKGFTINEKRLLEAKEKFAQLQQIISFLKEKSAKELLTGQEEKIQG